MTDAALYVPLCEGDLALVPLTEAHREGLRAACAADDAIWDIYPFNYLGDAFDPQFDGLLQGAPKRRVYAVKQAGRVIGMTAWIEQGQPGWSIEIGNTFIVPAARGTGLNDRVKRLLLDHAFACGLERVGFKVDARNTRSQAAVAKLGALREGVLRHERMTWTGHVRDTVSFSILKSEWQAR
ncbi:GNAT family N-acetyltransferase [Novosphingobium acidiphilum]|uniref:GNAT family N-acetyltransferase n=1 Tax=Novosphingobium acidiphilum TaxID=505248 RepID=UPI000415E873|nr:GNAT family protein [Novosphingobium acidiphilum]